MTLLQNGIYHLARQQITAYQDFVASNDDSDDDSDCDDKTIYSDDDSNDHVSESEGKDGEGLGAKLLGFEIRDIATFTLLLDKFQSSIDGFSIKVDLENGFLRVRTVPGLPHGAASGAFVYDIGFWSENNQPPVRRKHLKYTCDASICSSILSANRVRLSLFSAFFEISRCLIYSKGYNISTCAGPAAMEERSLSHMGV